jgi:hypothetical protein
LREAENKTFEKSPTEDEIEFFESPINNPKPTSTLQSDVPPNEAGAPIGADVPTSPSNPTAGGQVQSNTAEGTQIAENIINTNQGGANVPPDFKPEDKPIKAPAKDGASDTVRTITIGGVVVPLTIGGILTAIQSLIEKGFIDGKQVFDMILNLFMNNLKYVFALAGLAIVILIVKKIFKQLTFLLQVYLTARPDVHNPIIVPSTQSEPEPQRGFFGRLKYLFTGS